MKKTEIRWIALAAVMAVSTVGMAIAAPDQQDDPHAQHAAGQQEPGVPPSLDRMMAMYTQKLSLTTDQQMQIRPILQERQQKLMDLRNEGGRGMQKMRKMKQIRDDGDKKINAILTEDQKKLYAQLEEEQMEKMKQRRRGQRALDDAQ